MENTPEFPQIIKNRSTIQPSNSTAGNLSKENKIRIQKGYVALCSLQHYFQ